MSYELTHLRALEAEAIHVMREVAAELERPVLLFSGGKDSIVLVRLAEKATISSLDVFVNAALERADKLVVAASGE